MLLHIISAEGAPGCENTEYDIGTMGSSVPRKRRILGQHPERARHHITITDHTILPTSPPMWHTTATQHNGQDS